MPTSIAISLRRALLAAAIAAGAVSVPALAQDGGTPASAPHSSQELIDELDRTAGLVESDKPFHIALAMGRLYYGEGRFEDAARFLRQALEKADPLRAEFLRLRGDGRNAAPTDADAARCGFPPESAEIALAAQRDAVRSLAKKDPRLALSCARLALNPALDAQALLAGALVASGDRAGALAAYQAILQIAPEDPEALAAHAALLFESATDVPALKRARQEWTRYLELRPGASDAERVRKLLARVDEVIAAGGFEPFAKAMRAKGRDRPPGAPPTRAMAPGTPPPLARETIEAFQNAEVTPEMEANFARMIAEAEDHLARHDYEKALGNYRAIMPFRPENARVRAGLAWAMVALNRQPMADNVWRVAVGSDPAAVERLGETLESKGDSAGARALWSRLASSAPAYAQQSGLKARMEK